MSCLSYANSYCWYLYCLCKLIWCLCFLSCTFYMHLPLPWITLVCSNWVDSREHMKQWSFRIIPPMQERMQWSCVSTLKLQHTCRTSNITCTHICTYKRKEQAHIILLLSNTFQQGELEAKGKVVCCVYTYSGKKSRNGGITIISFKLRQLYLAKLWCLHRAAVTH